MQKISKNTFFYIVNDNYDQHAEFSIPFYSEMQNEIRSFVKSKQENLKVLDLGCGTGYTTKIVLEEAPDSKVYAIDMFDEMLFHAKKRLSMYSDVKYIKEDYRICDFPLGVDLCISSLAMHHILPLEKKSVFKKIYNSLSKDGIFIMIDWTKFLNIGLENIAFERIVEFVNNTKNDSIAKEWEQHWKNENIPNTSEEITLWLVEVGFKNVQIVFRYYGLCMIVAFK